MSIVSMQDVTGQKAMPLLSLTSKLVSLADSLSIPDGGFSIDSNSGHDIREGYAVSIYPECERIISGPVTATDILRYLLDMRDQLAHGVLGGWRDPQSGNAFLDVSVVAPDLDTAIDLARTHNQLAVYDFDAHESIPVPVRTHTTAA